MSRKKINFKYKKERAILSDVLPYEIPVTFSNRHFYEFITENSIRFDRQKNEIQWISNKNSTDKFILLLFGLKIDSQIHETASTKLGKPVNIKSVSLTEDRLITIPFEYKISHKINSHRELAICHPKQQLKLVQFYDEFKELILYYCGISPFSIRYPKKPLNIFIIKIKRTTNLYQKIMLELKKQIKNMKVCDLFLSTKTLAIYTNFSNHIFIIGVRKSSTISRD